MAAMEERKKGMGSRKARLPRRSKDNGKSSQTTTEYPDPYLPWVGATGMASKPGSLKRTNVCKPRNGVPPEVAIRRAVVQCRPCPNVGEAEAMREETGESTAGTTGVEVQAPRERLAEITSGRTMMQQGPRATCKDLWHKDKNEAEGGTWSGT